MKTAVLALAWVLALIYGVCLAPAIADHDWTGAAALAGALALIVLLMLKVGNRA